MRPADWLLLLVAGARDGLEPVRVQKALFLLAKEGGLPAEQRYEFEPYNYGPMSRGIYRDVARLVRRGLLANAVAPGYSRGVVKLTAAGREQAAAIDRIARHDAPSARMALHRISSLVQRLSFADLLRMVYDRYPAYASRSVFRRT